MNYSYEFFNQGLHQKHSVCGKGLNQRIFSFDPCSRCVAVQLLEKVLVNLISLEIQILNPPPPSVQFHPSKSKSKTQHL